MLNSIVGLLGEGGGVANSYESIATVTLGSSQSDITFSSIAGTYKHLQIRGIGFASSNGLTFRLRLNSDTTSSYATHYLVGDGASVSAGAITSTTSIIAGTAPESTTIAGALVCDILDYANVNKNKTTRSFAGADMNGSGGYATMYSGVWLKTDAVTSVTLTLLANSFTAGSTFALYGIKG
jgi:hypothetical protein